MFQACGSRQFFAEAAVQVPGRAVKMNASAYRDMFEMSPGLRDAVHRYVEQLISETRQFVACNSLHEVEARLCRLVLDALDRSGLERTLQRALARMLGAQRSTVAEVLARLGGRGIVTTRRGALVVEDRGAMANLCCGCRLAVRMTREAIWASRSVACEAAIAAE